MDPAIQQLQALIQAYGVYAVFILCTIEGDITLLLSGAMAHGGLFGDYGFIWVVLVGTLGGMVGDFACYYAGRRFSETVKHYRFYQMAQPRIEELVKKFGAFAVIISKYIYGIRVAMSISYGVGKMPLTRFLVLDAISCGLWVFLLSGAGYFFSGFITSIIGDFQHIGIALFFIVLTGVVVFYVLERFWLSEKVEEAGSETIMKIEEKLLAVEGAAEQRLHDLGERLHLTRDANTSDGQPETKPESKKAAQK